MRRLLMLLPVLAAAACAAVPDPAAAARDQQRLGAELAGRTAGAAVDCLPQNVNGGNESIGDDILFRDVGIIWVTHTNGGCSSLSGPGNYLVLDHQGGSQICRGDIAKVASSSGFLSGSCVLGAFTPYRR